MRAKNEVLAISYNMKMAKTQVWESHRPVTLILQLQWTRYNNPWYNDIPGITINIYAMSRQKTQ